MSLGCCLVGLEWPAFAVLAVLVPPGPRSVPGPGLGWQRLGWPVAAGPRPGTGTLGLLRAVGAQCPWFPGPRARGEVRHWPVVPRGLLAAAAGCQQGPVGLNYDAWPCPCTHVHASSSSSSHIPYESICDVVLELTRHGLDEYKHEARRGKQLARSLNPACEHNYEGKHDDNMTSKNFIDARHNIRRIHTLHYMLDIKRPVLTTWI